MKGEFSWYASSELKRAMRGCEGNGWRFTPEQNASFMAKFGLSERQVAKWNEHMCTHRSGDVLRKYLEASVVRDDAEEQVLGLRLQFFASKPMDAVMEVMSKHAVASYVFAYHLEETFGDVCMVFSSLEERSRVMDTMYSKGCHFVMPVPFEGEYAVEVTRVSALRRDREYMCVQWGVEEEEEEVPVRKENVRLKNRVKRTMHLARKVVAGIALMERDMAVAVGESLKEELVKQRRMAEKHARRAVAVARRPLVARFEDE
jgi:hypothetical protein